MKKKIGTNKREKLKVLKRQNGKCCLCGYKINTKSKHLYNSLTWEHIKPQSKGGNNSPENKKVAHYICNNIKGNKSLKTFYGLNEFLYIMSRFEIGRTPLKRYILYFKRYMHNKSYNIQHPCDRFGNKKSNKDLEWGTSED